MKKMLLLFVPILLLFSVGFITVSFAFRDNSLDKFREYYEFSKSEMKKIEVIETYKEFDDLVSQTKHDRSKEYIVYIAQNANKEKQAKNMKECLTVYDKLYVLMPTRILESDGKKSFDIYSEYFEKKDDVETNEITRTYYYKIMSVLRKTTGLTSENSKGVVLPVNSLTKLRGGVFNISKTF